MVDIIFENFQPVDLPDGVSFELMLDFVNENGLFVLCAVVSSNDSPLAKPYTIFDPIVELEPNVDRPTIDEKHLVSFNIRMENHSVTWNLSGLKIQQDFCHELLV